MKTMKMQAVHDSTASDGVLCWWELHGAVKQERFIDALSKHALDEVWLPRLPSENAALKRALDDVYSATTNVRTRQAPDGSVTALAESFETTANDVQRPVYSPMVTVWVNDESELCFDADVHEAEAIAEAFIRNLETYTTIELSAWLIGVVKACQAVPVRDSGGVYFVPRQHETLFRSLVKVLEGISECRVSLVPVLRTADAARAILDAVIRDATKDADALRDDVSNEKLGARALQGRAEKCRKRRESLSMFEELFETKLTEMRSTFDDVEAALVAAALAAEVAE